MILASSSPQRLALLREHGLDPAVVPADVDETPRPGEDPGELVDRLAGTKARAVARRHPGEVVLAADTVVVHDGTALGKPVDDRDAAATLRRLSGSVATVVTGVHVIGPGDERGGGAHTRLRFDTLSDADIRAYVATGEPHGAAGSFRLQGLGAGLVAQREGCRTNVIGLPMCVASGLLARAGVTLRPDECPA